MERKRKETEEGKGREKREEEKKESGKGLNCRELKEKYSGWRDEFQIFDPALLDLEVTIAKNVVYFHRNE